MTLHRNHQRGPRRTGVRLALKDQLELQQIVNINRAKPLGIPGDPPLDWQWNPTARLAIGILQRHGVEVRLDPHSGQVTFNPEVITA